MFAVIRLADGLGLTAVAVAERELPVHLEVVHVRHASRDLVEGEGPSPVRGVARVRGPGAVVAREGVVQRRGVDGLVVRVTVDVLERHRTRDARVDRPAVDTVDDGDHRPDLDAVRVVDLDLDGRRRGADRGRVGPREARLAGRAVGRPDDAGVGVRVRVHDQAGVAGVVDDDHKVAADAVLVHAVVRDLDRARVNGGAAVVTVARRRLRPPGTGVGARGLHQIEAGGAVAVAVVVPVHRNARLGRVGGLDGHARVGIDHETGVGRAGGRPGVGDGTRVLQAGGVAGRSGVDCAAGVAGRGDGSGVGIGVDVRVGLDARSRVRVRHEAGVGHESRGIVEHPVAAGSDDHHEGGELPHGRFLQEVVVTGGLLATPLSQETW